MQVLKKNRGDNMKTKAELKSMANYICLQEGQYLFSASEISKILGVCKDTTREICKNLEPAEFGRIKKYYIIDVLEFMYSQKK
jgi:Mn-dependent DtxR family transcriptional regulator